jgi:hypothetical protein
MILSQAVAALASTLSAEFAVAVSCLLPIMCICTPYVLFIMRTAAIRPHALGLVKHNPRSLARFGGTNQKSLMAMTFQNCLAIHLHRFAKFMQPTSNASFSCSTLDLQALFTSFFPANPYSNAISLQTILVTSKIS